MTSFNRSVCIATCAVGLLIAAVPAAGQTRRIDGGSAVLQTFAFHWETQLNPPTPPLADGSFFSTFDTAAPNQVHRMLVDRVKRVYFGYTVQIESQPDRNTFRLIFQPLSLTAALKNSLGDDASSWKPLPSTRFPAAQTIRSGEVLELSLLANNNWGQRLTEFVTVQEPPRAPGFGSMTRWREFSFAAGAPRDFTDRDGTLRLHDPRVFINGKFEESSARNTGEETGDIVWLYIPRRGRFLFSLVPGSGAGFRRVGEIRGTSLRFSVGGDTYSVTSGSRIAPGSAAYNVYVLHQPDWRPGYANADLDALTIGAADRVD